MKTEFVIVLLISTCRAEGSKSTTEVNAWPASKEEKVAPRNLFGQINMFDTGETLSFATNIVTGIREQEELRMEQAKREVQLEEERKRNIQRQIEIEQELKKDLEQEELLKKKIDEKKMTVDQMNQQVDIIEEELRKKLNAKKV